MTFTILDHMFVIWCVHSIFAQFISVSGRNNMQGTISSIFLLPSFTIWNEGTDSLPCLDEMSMRIYLTFHCWNLDFKILCKVNAECIGLLWFDKEINFSITSSSILIKRKNFGVKNSRVSIPAHLLTMKFGHVVFSLGFLIFSSVNRKKYNYVTHLLWKLVN